MGELSGNLTKKIIEDYQILRKITAGLQAAKHKIVVTIGSWDMLHIGHVRYLNRAKEFGDILVVGTDSDLAIAKYKGPHRPIVPQIERMEMLSYLDLVNFITIVDDVDDKGRWKYGLLRALKPDVFIAVEGSYPDNQLRAIARLTRQVEVLPRQAENTSSSGIFQKLIKTLPALATALDKR